MRAHISYPYDDQTPATVLDTADAVAGVLDAVEERASDVGKPITALYLSPDPPDRSSEVLEVGANGEVGYLRFMEAAPSDREWLTRGSTATGGEIEYGYQGHAYTGPVPASAEVPWQQVRQAVIDYVDTGVRPNLDWVAA